MSPTHLHHPPQTPSGARVDHLDAPHAEAGPKRSLLLMSAGQRLTGAAILLACLWAAVLWASG
jgi:hypothetical protein